MFSGFGEVLGLGSGPPTLADLIALVTCGSSQPGSRSNALRGRESEHPLRVDDAKPPVDPTDPVDPITAQATRSSEADPMETDPQGPSIQGPLSNIQGSAVSAASAAASLSRRLHLDPTDPTDPVDPVDPVCIQGSRRLHLDLATALPGEAVEALAEWMQNDAFLTK